MSKFVTIPWILVASIMLTPTMVNAHHWVSSPAPPEMPGDDGHWWLDTDSIFRNGTYMFFTFSRGSEQNIPPSDVGESAHTVDTGQMAIDCASGKTLAKGICSGTCAGEPAFPEDWLESARYSSRDELFKTVCGSRHADQ
jgi:hypothetical protein